MPQVLSFDDPAAVDHGLTGGKGANLSRLAQAGFVVPPGFCVSTRAYLDFLETDDLGNRVRGLLEGTDVDDQEHLTDLSAQIRGLIESTPVSTTLAEEISAGYERVCGGSYVAVRSSGTAEDLADASFAGQHDTYLDVHGADEVVAAVQRCWASLWTGRAMNYRRHHGFEHSQVLISVVVQVMVESEVSGVMFTANPLTTATDEIVVNASWGLGEALVQGIVTPDEYVIHASSGQVLDRSVGAKELRIVRDRVRGHGVVSEDVAAADRERYSLDDSRLADLVELGRRVEAHYGGIPQDIEWAFTGGRFFLLQSRPITGVEFSWDSDVEAGDPQPEPFDAVWTRAFADSVSTGAVTPLTYSVRYPQFSNRGYRGMYTDLGYHDLVETRHYKYWKGEVYFNVEPEKQLIQRLVWPPMRSLWLDFVPAVDHQAVLEAPFDLAGFLATLRNWHLTNDATTPFGFLKTMERWRTERPEIDGLPVDKLRELSDTDLVAYTEDMVALEGEWAPGIYIALLGTTRLLVSALHWMVQAWYGGDDPAMFTKLISGAIRASDTQLENRGLQELVEEIRKSDELTAAIETYADGDFFSHLDSIEGGRGFLARYADWIAEFGHRGQADRDLYYARRADDPSIDYQAFRVMLAAGGNDETHAREQQVNAQREAALAAIRTDIAAGSGGDAKVELLTTVYSLLHEYFVLRDNERFRPGDTIMYSYKRGFVEIGRRVHGRGLIEHERDFHFLARRELYDLLRGRVDNLQLLRMKIRARARDCDRMLTKQAGLPLHLHRSRPLNLDAAAAEHGDGFYRGTPTSSGSVTGTARVLADHREMSRIERGDLLITHSTDPGWNPIFSLIGGVIVETGGMLSHASCLAREYGFPAIHLPGATKLIPDGEIITVNGDAGTVRVAPAP